MTICHLRHSLRQNFSLLYLSPFQELLPQQIFLDLTLRTFFSLNWSSWDPGFDIDIEKFTLRKVRQCIVRFANPPLAYEVGLGTNLVLKSWEIWKRLFGVNTFDSWHWHWEVYPEKGQGVQRSLSVASLSLLRPQTSPQGEGHCYWLYNWNLYFFKTLQHGKICKLEEEKT